MRAGALLLAAGLLAASGARAQMEIESDSMYIENEESVFESNVVVTGDGIGMDADEIRIGQQGGTITARGDPAMLSVDRQDRPMTVWAPEISYDPEGDRVLLPAGGRIASAEVTVTAGWISADIGAGSAQARQAVRLSSAQATGQADELELHPAGAMQMRGMPARLDMTADDGQAVQGRAGIIRLDGDGRLLHLEGDASAVHGDETIAAEKITYNLETGELATEAKPGQRVRMVISELP